MRHEIRPMRRSFVKWFSRLERAVFRGICDEIFVLFQACVGNFDTIPPWKVVGTLYLASSCVTFKDFAFLSVCDEFELLGHVQAAIRRFDCNFRRSSWIHSWLLLAILSDYYGQVVTSTFLLCKFRGLPGATPDSFPVMRRGKCLGMKRLSQRSSTTPGKRAEKLA